MFKQGAVRLVLGTSKTVRAVSPELDLTCMRAHSSDMNAVYAKRRYVATQVKSDIQRRLGRLVLLWRYARSGHRPSPRAT